jgi:membrane protein
MTLGLLGQLNLTSAWRSDIAPQVRDHVSSALYIVISDTVAQVLGAKQVWWVTLGAGLTIWQVSAAVRGVMEVLDAVYDVRSQRGTWHKLAVSIGLAIAAAVLLLGAVAVVQFGDSVVGGLLGTLVRWVVALGLLTTLIGVMVRFAPSRPRPWAVVTRGSVATIVCWIVTSVGFGVYLRQVANYGSIFGNLATVIITLEYFYLSTLAFLTGLTLDRLAEEET